LHSRKLVEDGTFFQHHWDLYEYDKKAADMNKQRPLLAAQQNFLEGNAGVSGRAFKDPPPCSTATRGPVIVQLAGHDVDVVTRAAMRILESTNYKVAGIDLNLGCPQGIARKGGYGAFLMEDDEHTVYSILRSLRQTLPPSVAISAKIRLPVDASKQKDRIQRLCDTGITFLTVHGRDLTENKTTVTGVHVDRLAAAVETANLFAAVPVIVNGGIETADDIPKLLRGTGAAAVMSSEALLERPTLFLANADTTTTTTPRARFAEQLQSASHYLQWCRYAPPLPGVLGAKGGSFNVVRGHLFKMLYRYMQDHMDLRDCLADNFTFHRLEQAEALLEALRDRYQDLTDAEWDALPSSNYPDSSWYRRHWAAAGLAHQRSKWNASIGAEQPPPPPPLLSVDERKRQMRERIAKLRSRTNDNSLNKASLN
jgi:tRNA-dihydrouridine synthase 1